MKNMIISSEVAGQLNQALEKEMYASHMYKHFAIACQFLGYFGSQSFFNHESQDELEHFQLIVDFLNDVGVQAEMPSTPEMTDKPQDLKSMLNMALDTEKKLLTFYSGLYSSSDPVAQQFLLGLIEIQRKAVGEYGDLIARLEIIKDDPCGLIIFDQEMKK
jgi:ferritin